MSTDVATRPAAEKYLRIAREIAINIMPLEAILESQGVSLREWEEAQRSPRLREFLSEEIALWHGSPNTQERVKLKAAAAIEEWMPTLFTRVNNRNESLAAVVEGGKFLARLAGMGEKTTAAETGERFQLTINIGKDDTTKITTITQSGKPVEDDE